MQHEEIDGQWKHVQKELERQAEKSRELSRLEQEQESRKRELDVQEELLAREEIFTSDGYEKETEG